MPTESNLISTSPTPGLGSVNGAISERKYSLDSGSNGGAGKLATMTYDPTPYIQRARVTRPAPPKPSTNPMQFVQIKPCNLYQSAQEQLKKAEEVKKVKEIKKEEPEDWQSNLDNWKSSRRKRVEHIIDRVVEVKKLELEEHDRMRRKSKTFSEMMEERSSRRSKLASLTVYKEDEPNDFSDLGIGTSSASGKSSLSEDCDNHSVMSDNADTDKPAPDSDSHLNHENGISNRDFISSPGYDTSSSTAPSTDSPDPCEYTYEGAIQDYKIRISRAQSNTSRNSISSPNLKDSSTEHPIRPMGSSKIESRLMNFEMKSPNEQNTNEMILPKKDLPKVDVLKRREQFEKDNSVSLDSSNNQRRLSGDFTNAKRLSNRLSGDITSLKDRLQNLEKQTSVVGKNSKIDVHVTPLKDRLSSLQNATAKEEVVKKPILLVDEHQLEMLKKEELEKQNALRREVLESDNLSSSQEILNLQDESNMDTDREDSGIHTTDVSCSVSQTDEQPDLVSEEPHHPLINAEDGLCQNIERQKSNIDEKSKDSTTKKHHPSPDTITNSSSVEQKTITTTKTLQSKTEDGMNTPEPVASIDQDVSVSLFLSESPTASSQTVIFNGKMANETGGSLDSTSLSQLLVEGALGVDNCSQNISNNKYHHVDITNTLSSPLNNTYSTKFDIEKRETNAETCKIDSSLDFDQNANTYIPFKDSKFSKNNPTTVPQDKINIEKWIEQNFEQNRNNAMEDQKTNFSNVDIEFSETSQSKSTENKIQETNESQKFDIENSKESLSQPLSSTNTKNTKKTRTKGTFERGVYGEVVFDSKSMLSKSSKKLIENSKIAVDEQTKTIAKPQEKLENPPEIKIQISNLESKIQKPSLPSPPPKNQQLNSSPKDKRKTIIETCEKVDVHDLPDPSHIPTPFIDINVEDFKEDNPQPNDTKLLKNQKPLTKIPIPTKPLLPDKPKSVSSSPSKENSLKSNNSKILSVSLPNNTPTTTDSSPNGIIVAKIEVVETKIKVTSNDVPSESSDTNSPTKSIHKLPVSPKINTKTYPDSKPKNIFDFLRKNFYSNANDDDNIDGSPDSASIAVDNSKFYVPLEEEKEKDEQQQDKIVNNNMSGNDVNIKITKTIKTDRIIEKADSLESDATMTNEINQLLDEEFSKLSTATVEDTRL